MATAAEEKGQHEAHMGDMPPPVAIVTTNVTSHVSQPPVSEKRVCDAYVLAIGLGFLGAHHFYLRRPCWGVLYLFTFGLFGVGYIVDWCRVPFLVKDANRKLSNPDMIDVPHKTLGDAYLLWFPLGFFGKDYD